MPFLPAKISVIWMEFTILIAHKKKNPTKLDRVIAIWHNISVKKCHPKWNYSRIQQWLIWSIMNPGLHKGRSELLQTNERQFPTSFCAFGKKKMILPSIQQKTKVELERWFFFFQFLWKCTLRCPFFPLNYLQDGSLSNCNMYATDNNELTSEASFHFIF